MRWVKRKFYFVASATLAFVLAGIMLAHLANKPVTASDIVSEAARMGARPAEVTANKQNISRAPETPEITLNFKFRAVSLNKTSGRPEADKLVAYSVLDEIRHSPAFAPEKTQVATDLSPSEQTGTYTWSIVAGLKPLRKTY